MLSFLLYEMERSSFSDGMKPKYISYMQLVQPRMHNKDRYIHMTKYLSWRIKTKIDDQDRFCVYQDRLSNSDYALVNFMLVIN